ncbi:SDR family oxidoreductase [Sphingobacterium sp. LRF_L2]|uniref:SDR family oxidoreductase n=1 Tax=Sphingobacterium sp. LRF_L2 TaxID=3369421 RepID=UPI003F5E695E
MDQLKPKLLITGANGFLGQKLVEKIVPTDQYIVYATSNRDNRNHLKEGYIYISSNFEQPDSLKQLLEEVKPDFIIHTAAISSVEACENNPAACKKINIDSVLELGEYCKKYDKYLLFLSTDFVFDGENGPYTESDRTKSLNAYGSTKIAAEETLKKTNCRASILRTILVYGVNGDRERSNLVLWAKKQLEIGTTIRVVQDQWRMPTFVDDLVKACQTALEKEAEGIYHISGSEMMSILEIAQGVASFWNLDTSLITPISAAEINQATNRPRKTGFILDKAAHELGYRPTSFLDSLQEIDKQLKFYKR